MSQSRSAAKRPSPRSSKRSGRSLSSHLFAIVPLVLVVLGATAAGVVARSAQDRDALREDRIAQGVRVGLLDLSGKSPQEAHAALQQHVAQKQPLLLHFAPETGIQRVWKVDADKLGLGVDVQATLEKAHAVQRPGLLTRAVGWVSGPTITSIAPHTTVDEAKCRAWLQKEVAPAIARRPKNARLVRMAGGGLGTHHEQRGRALDVTASIAAIAHAWEAFHNSPPPPAGAAPTTPPSTEQSNAPAPQSETQTPNPSPTPKPVDVTLVVKEVPAAITAAELEPINGSLAAYSSHYTGIANRLHNVELAASHIDGTILRPGDIFSYNRVVGPREQKNGFRMAPEIVHGQHKMGVGGGVCQVSSTLFNAVLLSGLKITQRSHHAFPIGYIPDGRDATVVYGSIDFQFQNDTDAPIAVFANASRGRLVFTIYGKQNPNRKISLERTRHTVQRVTQSDTQTDPTLPAGKRKVLERPKNGEQVTWVRTIRENGAVVRRDTIVSDYKPTPGVIVIGTRAVKTVKTVKPRTRPKPSTSVAPPATPATDTPPAAKPSAPGDTQQHIQNIQNF